jgi:hypothetical protein
MKIFRTDSVFFGLAVFGMLKKTISWFSRQVGQYIYLCLSPLEVAFTQVNDKCLLFFL